MRLVITRAILCLVTRVNVCALRRLTRRLLKARLRCFVNRVRLIGGVVRTIRAKDANFIQQVFSGSHDQAGMRRQDANVVVPHGPATGRGKGWRPLPLEDRVRRWVRCVRPLIVLIEEVIHLRVILWLLIEVVLA